MDSKMLVIALAAIIGIAVGAWVVLQLLVALTGFTLD